MNRIDAATIIVGFLMLLIFKLNKKSYNLYSNLLDIPHEKWWKYVKNA